MADNPRTAIVVNEEVIEVYTTLSLSLMVVPVSRQD